MTALAKIFVWEGPEENKKILAKGIDELLLILYNTSCRQAIKFGQNLVAVVKWLTRRIVAPLREGSTPSSHPTLLIIPNPVGA